MSDEQQDAVDETDGTETDGTETDGTETEGTTDQADTEESETDKPGGSTRMPSMLSRESDYVQRPGFRNPSNKKSKAQKKKRKGKKKR